MLPATNQHTGTVPDASAPGKLSCHKENWDWDPEIAWKEIVEKCFENIRRTRLGGLQ